MANVQATDLMKGERVRLANGWEADLADNQRRGHTRLAKVYGYETEYGSVYTTDIVAVRRGVEWFAVEHTANQKKAAQARKAMGF